MMLVQKPPHFNISPAHFPLQHRRHPSAPPAVLVQPTRTPGLLSLSKPAQRVQQPQQRAKPSPKAKHAAAAVRRSPQLSTSNSSVRGRRNNTRQASPPLSHTPSSQAEVPCTPPRKHAAAAVDPSLSDDASPVAVPQFLSQPTGKLACRRQSQQLNSFTTPPSSRAIPVPQRPKSIPPSLSHDDEYPSTPSRSKAKRFDDGPKTAPLTTSFGVFPFNVALPPSPSPPARKKGRKHVRTPSEGVFHMSSDEDLSSSSSDEQSHRRKTISLMKAGKLTQAEMEAAVAAGYFASSTFQNSPSPEELPPPIFV
ncbi:hypothetical protein CPB85DRAFT_1373749 [Mucidula mucida]|nr:hypothetical protein CPB85DRAFT_1373749 [Mucidula mucida]